MSKLIIHAGQMKSSTTYIQKVLSKNRNLLKNSGVIYPGTGENHQILFYKVCGSYIYWRNGKPNLNHPKFKKLLNNINIHRDAGRDVLLSAEGLSSMGYNGVEFLYNALGGFDTAIFTVRSLHKTLPSAWQQTLKSGNTCSLAEFFEKLQNDRPLLNGYWSTYAFGNIAKIWSLFSEVNAVLLPNESKSDNHSWELFLKSIDLNLKKEVNFPEEKINSSISLNTARLMRAISIRSEELGVNKREVARWFYNKFVLGSEVRGEKILPPENFKKALDDWNKNELSVLKDSVSSLICTEDIANDFENYDGSWLNKDSDVERVKDFDNEVAIHILNFFKNQSKR